jgi:hypothetical protein
MECSRPIPFPSFAVSAAEIADGASATRHLYASLRNSGLSTPQEAVSHEGDVKIKSRYLPRRVDAVG